MMSMLVETQQAFLQVLATSTRETGIGINQDYEQPTVECHL